MGNTQGKAYLLKKVGFILGIFCLKGGIDVESK